MFPLLSLSVCLCQAREKDVLEFLTESGFHEFWSEVVGRRREYEIGSYCSGYIDLCIHFIGGMRDGD